MISDHASRVIGQDSPPIPAEADRLQAQSLALSRLAEELHVLGASFLVPLMKLMQILDLDETVYERAYRPETIEKEMKILVMLDKRMDKLIARFVQLEEIERLYRAKEVKPRQIDAIEPPAEDTDEAEKPDRRH